ncbi:unnamed protein product [Clavelina lepadiformis]|uniref:Uncharacterized protein n=1 Tax=Clavelina lepadiformis TaxID=159417 RepID=A0ABP0G7J9_CLALP
MCQPSTVKNLDFVASKFGDFLPTFQARYQREFGFANPGCDIINDGGRVGGIELSGIEDHALVTSSGTTCLLVRSFRTRWWSCFQRSSHPRPPRGHAGCRAVPDDGDTE